VALLISTRIRAAHEEKVYNATCDLCKTEARSADSIEEVHWKVESIFDRSETTVVMKKGDMAFRKPGIALQVARQVSDAVLEQRREELFRFREDNKNEIVTCADCGARMILRYSGKNDGFFWGCTEYPECRGTHGAHLATGAPLGVPANSEVKHLRIEAHALFDELWKGPVPLYTRRAAYEYLSELMMLPPEKAHIASFDGEQCKRLITLLTNRAGQPAQQLFRRPGQPPTTTVQAQKKEPEPEVEPNRFGRKLDI